VERRETGDETILKGRRNRPETNQWLSIGIGQCGPSVGMSAMVEIAAVLMGLFSACIFVAHAVDAYQAQ
jgi:hypothetical protein